MKQQFQMYERGTDKPSALTVIVSGPFMTLIAGHNRKSASYRVPKFLQPELLRTMRRKCPTRMAAFLDEIERVQGNE